MSVDLNYFTCTLGEADRLKNQLAESVRKPPQTVNELIDEQATQIPTTAALGFANFKAEHEGR